MAKVIPIADKKKYESPVLEYLKQRDEKMCKAAIEKYRKKLLNSSRNSNSPEK